MTDRATKQEATRRPHVLFGASLACMVLTFGSLGEVTGRPGSPLATTLEVVQLVLGGVLLLYVGRLVATHVAD